jgi:hypothetical protein
MQESDYRALCSRKPNNHLIKLLAQYERRGDKDMFPRAEVRIRIIEEELSGRGMSRLSMQNLGRNINDETAHVARAEAEEKKPLIHCFINVYTFYAFSIAAVILLGWLTRRGVALYALQGTLIAEIISGDPMIHDIFIYGPIFGLVNGWLIHLIPIRLGADLQLHGLPLPLSIEERSPPRTGMWLAVFLPPPIYLTHLIMDALIFILAELSFLLYLFHYLPDQYINPVGMTLFFSYTAFFVGLYLWGRKQSLEEGEPLFGPIFTPLQLWLLIPAMILFAICIPLAVTLNSPDMGWNTFSICFELAVVGITVLLIRSLVKSIRRNK